MSIDTTAVRSMHDAWGCDPCSSPIMRCWLAVALDEVDALRARLAAVSEELDKPTNLCPPGAKRDRRYASRVIADLEEPR